MSYTPDPVNKDIVISGFSAGVGTDPYTGPSDMKSIGLESIPNEASVAYATQRVSAVTIGNVSVTSASTVGNTVRFATTTNLEANMAVVVSASTIGGVTVGNVYWLGTLTPSGGNTDATLYKNYGQQNQATIASSGTATFVIPSMTQPQYFAQDQNNHYYCVDNNGNCWSDLQTTTSGKWTFLGNSVAAQGGTAGTPSNGITGKTGTDVSYGNGLFIYGTPGSGHNYYLFVFSNGSIDFMTIGGTYPWTYGWNPVDASTGNAGPYSGWTASGNYLGGTLTPHQAIVGPDNNIYYLNGYNINKIELTTPGTFVPTSAGDFTQSVFPLIPTNDIAQCIAQLGTMYLIGGIKNIVYVWDSTSSLASYYILLSENNITQLVTVNTNTYIFVGNRGRIWITNGSQAQIFKKVPDHISGTIDPLFVWGGATYNWNQLYFGLQAYNNAGTKIANYGGLWSIDLTTGALRNVGQMSYATYSGYITAVFAKNTTTNPQGYGLLMGWDDGAGNGGADQSIDTPYTGGQSWITSELIPVGLAIDPESPTQLEFKLSRPLVLGESVQLKVGQYFDPSYATFSSCLFSSATSFSTVGAISGITDGMPLDKFQWIIVQAILTSIASSPSFVRLTELRIKNAAVAVSSYGAIQ